MLERSLALRRRRGTASGSGSPTPGCGWVAAAAGADELGCRCEEPATADVVEAGSTAEETEMFDPSCFSCFGYIDLARFVTDLDLVRFVTDLDSGAFLTDPDSGVIILEALDDDRVTDDTAHDQGCRLEEAATPDAVGSDPADDEETDPYSSFYFGMTL